MKANLKMENLMEKEKLVLIIINITLDNSLMVKLKVRDN